MLTKIFDVCLFGDKLVITDILDADLNGYLPNTVSGDKESHDGPLREEGQKAKPQETSLLPYLSDRPKLVSCHQEWPVRLGISYLLGWIMMLCCYIVTFSYILAIILPADSEIAFNTRGTAHSYIPMCSSAHQIRKRYWSLV